MREGAEKWIDISWHGKSDPTMKPETSLDFRKVINKQNNNNSNQKQDLSCLSCILML